MISTFEGFINQTVTRIFILVWPPFGEESFRDIDLSVGLTLSKEPQHLYVITTDKDDLWTPLIRLETIPSKIHDWHHFDGRVRHWMNSLGGAEPDDEFFFDTEYYEATKADLFRNIVSKTIRSIELIGIKDDPVPPFGVRLLFDDDFIQSTPIADGNTIETSRFNRIDNHLVFRHFGTVEFRFIR